MEELVHRNCTVTLEEEGGRIKDAGERTKRKIPKTKYSRDTEALTTLTSSVWLQQAAAVREKGLQTHRGLRAQRQTAVKVSDEAVIIACSVRARRFPSGAGGDHK